MSSRDPWQGSRLSSTLSPELLAELTEQTRTGSSCDPSALVAVLLSTLSLPRGRLSALKDAINAFVTACSLHGQDPWLQESGSLVRDFLSGVPLTRTSKAKELCDQVKLEIMALFEKAGPRGRSALEALSLEAKYLSTHGSNSNVDTTSETRHFEVTQEVEFRRPKPAIMRKSGGSTHQLHRTSLTRSSSLFSNIQSKPKSARRRKEEHEDSNANGIQMMAFDEAASLTDLKRMREENAHMLRLKRQESAKLKKQAKKRLAEQQKAKAKKAKETEKSRSQKQNPKKKKPRTPSKGVDTSKGDVNTSSPLKKKRKANETEAVSST